MNRLSSLAPGVALVWAGVSLGGSLIAAPAKFQAPSLTLPTALEVGRAQFLWVGIGEGILCAAFLLALVLFRGVNWGLAVIPVLLFAVQRLVVMPPLDARTLQVIAGQDVGESGLHVVFIILEVAKFLALGAAGFVGFLYGRRRA